jgi:hypothetical protein
MVQIGGGDQRGMVLALERRQEAERRRQRAGDAARLTQIDLGNAAGDRLVPRPEPAGLPMLAMVVVARSLGRQMTPRGVIAARRCALAGQHLDRSAEAAALEKHHKVDCVAPLAAASPAVEQVLADIDRCGQHLADVRNPRGGHPKINIDPALLKDVIALWTAAVETKASSAASRGRVHAPRLIDCDSTKCT